MIQKPKCPEDALYEVNCACAESSKRWTGTIAELLLPRLRNCLLGRGCSLRETNAIEISWASVALHDVGTTNQQRRGVADVGREL